MPHLTLSIIIPCYNEEKVVGETVRRVLATDIGQIHKDVIVIDDGSSDRSAQIVQEIERHHPAVLRLLVQPKNKGKGAAVWRGMLAARGELIVIQDADLEYHPQDFRQMLPLFDIPHIDVVFGSRRLLPDNPVSGVAEYIGAQIINTLSNLLYRARITDQFTCYKMFRRELVPQLKMRTRRFEFDAELTAKLLRLGKRIQEVPIRYTPRSRAEGKKIRWRDGVSWMWQLIKLRFISPKHW